MDLSGRFVPQGEPLSGGVLSDEEVLLLTAEVMLDADGAPAARVPAVVLPMANPDALRVYPEHVLIIALFLVALLSGLSALIA